jgi:hypothetical protein
MTDYFLQYRSHREDFPGGGNLCCPFLKRGAKEIEPEG